jgi:hypothetical protein
VEDYHGHLLVAGVTIGIKLRKKNWQRWEPPPTTNMGTPPKVGFYAKPRLGNNKQRTRIRRYIVLV